MSWCGFVTCDGPPSTQEELERLWAVEKELERERSRNVQHRQMNQSLNETVQAWQKQAAWMERQLAARSPLLQAVNNIPTPTLARMLAFRDRPECAAEVAFAVAALRARGIEVNEPERGVVELDEAQEEERLDLNDSDDFEVDGNGNLT